MMQRNVIRMVSMALALMLALCQAAGAEVRYPLNEHGEAIVNDVVFTGDGGSCGNARVFYEIFVGSFSDSNGDGVGDLRGIINRMDYLNDGDPGSGVSLGVEGIWLTPVFASPSYHKYDIADYYAIDPAFGTMDDLRELIELCHARGVKLILDLAINHTSLEHPWFRHFKNAHLMNNDQSIYYDYYSWCEAGSTYPAGRRFNPLSGTKIAYECNFSSSMPELNYDNPAVRQAVLEVAKYYLDMGVDGFRFDAAKYLYMGDNEKCADFWTWFTGELRAIRPEIYLVAEVWDSDGVTDRYVPALNCFNFTTSQTSGLIAATAKQGKVGVYMHYIDSYLDEIHALNPDAMYLPFIANHDTDRAAGYLTVASGNMKLAANLYILTPGSPFIYYGEEIGLRGSRGAANTDANRRLAMLWGDGDTVRDPIGATYEAKNQTPYAVADLLGISDSIYNYYKRLLMIRRANPEIASGTFTVLEQLPDEKLGGFVAAQGDSRAAVLHNTTLRDMTVVLADTQGLEAFTTLAAAIGVGNASLENGVLTIEAQTSVVLR